MSSDGFSSQPCWQRFPLVAADNHAKAWLTLTFNRGKDHKTIDAYGRAVNSFLSFLDTIPVQLLKVTEEHVALFIRHMRTGGKVRDIASGGSLKNSTMQQRLSAIRLLFDYLLRKKLVSEHPAPRGLFHQSRKAFTRGILQREYRLPWIPTDEEWLLFLKEAKKESLRNRVMLLLAYEGALRRETLIGLDLGDMDVSNRLITIRPEIVKNGRGSVVSYSPTTAILLNKYLVELKQQAKRRSVGGTALFRSFSDRNYGAPLTVSSWNKIITAIAKRAKLPCFSTHTLRHLRLTHMARAGFDLPEIAKYAGHSQPQTTMNYIHLSGRDLQAKFAKNTQELEAQLLLIVENESL